MKRIGMKAGGLIALLAFCIIPPEASAVLVGITPGGTQPDTTVNADATPVSGKDASWTLGSSSSPISVDYAATSGLWSMKLAGSPMAEPGDTFQIHEYLRIGADSPNWSHWGQEFATEGFNFTGGTLSANGDVVSTGYLLSDDNAIKFDFDTLAAGTMIEIVKNFTWVGTAGGEFRNNWSGDPLVIQFRQYPRFTFQEPDVVPEPASIALMSVGLLLMLGVATVRKGNRVS